MLPSWGQRTVLASADMDTSLLVYIFLLFLEGTCSKPSLPPGSHEQEYSYALGSCVWKLLSYSVGFSMFICLSLFSLSTFERDLR